MKTPGLKIISKCRQCGRPPMKGSEYCWFHNPEMTDTERSLILSKAQHEAKLQRLDLQKIDKIETVADIQVVVGKLILDLVHGKIASRNVVQDMCTACLVFLKAVEKNKFSEELAIIYRRVEELDKGVAFNGV